MLKCHVLQEAALAANVEALSRVAGNVTLHPQAAGTTLRWCLAKQCLVSGTSDPIDSAC